MNIKTISVVGESHKRLEDFHLINMAEGRLKVAVGDWANNLVGGPFIDGETLSHLSLPREPLNGGVIGATLAKRTIHDTDLTGIELIKAINDRLARKYEELGVRDFETNPAVRFTGYIAHILVDRERTIITAVGDVKVAVDGKVIAGKRKKIDDHHSRLRSDYIANTKDVDGAYNRILRHKIIAQYGYQNNPGHEFSYPAIDGTETRPTSEITVLEIPTPKKFLLWTDGYETPDEGSFHIAGLEAKLNKVWAKDPGRHREYPSVGCLQDDRTAVEIDVDNWESARLVDLTGSFIKLGKEVKR